MCIHVHPGGCTGMQGMHRDACTLQEGVGHPGACPPCFQCLSASTGTIPAIFQSCVSFLQDNHLSIQWGGFLGRGGVGAQCISVQTCIPREGVGASWGDPTKMVPLGRYGPGGSTCKFLGCGSGLRGHHTHFGGHAPTPPIARGGGMHRDAPHASPCIHWMHRDAHRLWAHTPTAYARHPSASFGCTQMRTRHADVHPCASWWMHWDAGDAQGCMHPPRGRGAPWSMPTLLSTPVCLHRDHTCHIPKLCQLSPR